MQGGTQHEQATDATQAYSEASSESAQTVCLDADSARQACKTDLDFFASLLLGGVASCPFPPFYHILWRLLTEATSRQEAAKVFRFALGLPRGHAKSTFVKLLACWCILHAKASFVLIVAATEALALNVIADVHFMLSSDNVRRLWGDWERSLVKNTTQVKRGIYNGNSVIMYGIGSGSSVRGLNLMHERPDFIICDDMQTKENAHSAAESASLRHWFAGTLLKARDMDLAIVIYIGNMYNEECILRMLQKNPQWMTFVTGAILADWKVLWPEKFTLQQLLLEYEHDVALGEGDVWFSEVLNIPSGGALSLLPDGKLPECPEEDMEAVDTSIGAFVIIDPAGYRKDSDDTAIVGYKVYASNTYVATSLIHKRMTPGECIEACLKMVSELKATHIFVESVAYQQTLIWHIEEALRNTPSVKVHELKPRRRAKLVRIRTWLKEVQEGTFGIGKATRAAVLFQALGFRLDRTDNRDDILDAMAYGVDVRNEYHTAIIGKYNGTQGETVLSSGVVDGNSCLDM